MADSREIINQLSPNDAFSILKTLAESDEQIAKRIAEMALANLSKVDPEEVAADLYDELDLLEVEEVWDRAGSTRHGYVEPHEAAEEMIDEVVAPYLAELKKYQKLGMNTEANKMCMGLLLGLYRFEHESTSEFKNWAVDAAGAFAWSVVDAWKTGSPGPMDIEAVKEFVEDELGGWEARSI